MNNEEIGKVSCERAPSKLVMKIQEANEINYQHKENKYRLRQLLGRVVGELPVEEENANKRAEPNSVIDALDMANNDSRSEANQILEILNQLEELI